MVNVKKMYEVKECLTNFNEGIDKARDNNHIGSIRKVFDSNTQDVDVNEIFDTKEKLIKTLVNLRLKKNLSIISDNEFRDEVAEVYVNEFYCDFFEHLAINAFEDILEIIADVQLSYGEVELLFNEKVVIQVGSYFTERMADIIIIGKEYLEVIKVVSLECDLINVCGDNSLKLIGIGVIDKFLCATGADKIVLTIVQPNFLSVAQYKIPILKLLDEAKNCLMNEIVEES